MKHIFEYLFSKKSDLDKIKTNRFGITKKDMIGALERFPIGVVVRMLEETEKPGNKHDIKVFQYCVGYSEDRGGFRWRNSDAGRTFWIDVILHKNFDKFYQRYPDYKKYDL